MSLFDECPPGPLGALARREDTVLVHWREGNERFSAKNNQNKAPNRQRHNEPTGQPLPYRRHSLQHVDIRATASSISIGRRQTVIGTLAPLHVRQVCDDVVVPAVYVMLGRVGWVALLSGHCTSTQPDMPQQQPDACGASEARSTTMQCVSSECVHNTRSRWQANQSSARPWRK